MKIYVIGSCVSHDALSCFPRRHTVKGYTPRHSLAAAFAKLKAPESVIDAVKRNVPDATHRFWLLAGLEGRVEQILWDSFFDYVLLDCVDERLNLRKKNDCVVSLSSEFKRAEASLPGFVFVQSGSDEHLALWKGGLARLFSVVDPNRTIVNMPYFADRTLGGEAMPDPEHAERMNVMLRTMYGHVEANYPCRFIEYDESLLKADPQHKWGLDRVHYGLDFYRATVDALDQIDRDDLRRVRCAGTVGQGEQRAQ